MRSTSADSAAEVPGWFTVNRRLLILFFLPLLFLLLRGFLLRGRTLLGFRNEGFLAFDQLFADNGVLLVGSGPFLEGFDFADVGIAALGLGGALGADFLGFGCLLNLCFEAAAGCFTIFQLTVDTPL